jgi:S-adenosylmethionine:tRNA ribosyltransferase-isomerase
MNTSDFQFELPPGQIARHPVEPRDHARLMVIDRAAQSIEHARFDQLGQWIHPQDLLLLNNTRVIKARLRNPEEGTEFLLLRQVSPTRWLAIGRPGRKLKPGLHLKFPPHKKKGSDPFFEVTILEALENGERLVEFDSPPDLQQAGVLPLPPYIEKARADSNEPLYEARDDEDYQTVYAEKAGSVAAPTAGLHFTRELLDRFRHTALTLDIGLGTFRPVQAERIEDHTMHTESYEIPEGLAEIVEATRTGSPPLSPEACAGGIGEVAKGRTCPPELQRRRRGSPPGRLVAVGTTVCRVIESL